MDLLSPMMASDGSSTSRSRRFSAFRVSKLSTFSSVTAAMPAAEFKNCTWSSANRALSPVEAR